jgi:tRNA G46 methylase TrmB
MTLLKKIVPRPLKYLYRRIRSQIRGGTAACYVRGLTIRASVSSEIEEFRVNTYSTKEPDTLDWIDANLRDGDIVFDIGANIGLYTLYAAKRNPRCTVYAFEPAFQNFASLCRNIALNALTNVVPCNTPLVI